MVHFVVTTPAIGYSAASITGAVAQFDAQVKQVSAAVNAVAGATWTGSAADAFLKEWTEFLKSADITREALASIAVRLQGAQTAYETNESQLTASNRSVAVNVRAPGLAAKDEDEDEQPPVTAQLAHGAAVQPEPLSDDVRLRFRNSGNTGEVIA